MAVSLVADVIAIDLAAAGTAATVLAGGIAAAGRFAANYLEKRDQSVTQQTTTSRELLISEITANRMERAEFARILLDLQGKALAAIGDLREAVQVLGERVGQLEGRGGSGDHKSLPPSDNGSPSGTLSRKGKQPWSR